MALYQQAAALFVEVLGHDHMATIKTCRGEAVSYMNVANVYDSQGKYEEALDKHQKSLDIKIKVAGHDHKEVADSKWNMAMMFEAQGKRAEARKLFLECEQIYSKAYGPHHAETYGPHHMALTMKRHTWPSP